MGQAESFNGLSDEQKAAVAACDATLNAAGLLTYSAIEEQVFAISTMCLESVQMGKAMVERVKQLEKKIAQFGGAS